MPSLLFEPGPIDAYPSKDAWDAVRYELLDAMASRWELQLLGSFEGGVAGVVERVRRPDGTEAVLKVGFPHFEGRWEAVGLDAFADGTAPRVLDADPWTWSLLLEPVIPGTPLSAAPLDRLSAVRAGAAAYAAAVDVTPPRDMLTLEDTIDAYLANARARWPGQLPILDAAGITDAVRAALDEGEQLARDVAPVALLHGDANPGNILLSGSVERGSWLLIDPKPMTGDPAFDLAPLVDQLGDPHRASAPPERLMEQLALAAEITGIDPHRSLRWALVRAALDVTWAIEDGVAAEIDRALRRFRNWSAATS